MAPVIVFDGVCNLCHASVQFVLRHDRRERFRFAASQTDAGRQLLGRHGIDPDQVSTVYLIEGGRVSSKSTAALRIARGLGFPWSLASIFNVVPRVLRDWVYDLIARNRYRLFGRAEGCRLPTERERGRFVTVDDPLL